MTFLLIGSSGLLGRHLAASLAGRGVVLTAHHDARPGARFLDVRDRDAVVSTMRDVRPDVILLAAAEPHVERCEREPADTRRVNVDAAAVIAAEAERGGSLLVTFSSDYVFDGTAGPYDESAPVAPLNEYGRQKVALERIAAGVRRHLIVRTSGLYGWETGRKNLVCQVVDRLRTGGVVDIAADQLITPTYAPDIAAAITRLVDSGAHGVYHVAGPKVMTRLAWALLIAETFGLPVELIRARHTEELGLLAPRPRRAGLDTSKLTLELGPIMRQPAEALVVMRGAEALA